MKKSLVFMIAVLLVGALMISCNSDVSEGVSGGDSLAKVTVMSGTSKALTTVVSGSTDVEDLYWYYTATKTDGSLFTTGQTTEKKLINTFDDSGNPSKNHGLLNADLGLFSTGSWSFSFYGYAAVDNAAPGSLENLNPVYYQENLAATVTTTTNLTVTLVEGEGMGDATIKFSYGTGESTQYPNWTYDLAPANTSLTLNVYSSDPSAVPAPAAVVFSTKTTNSSGRVDFNDLADIKLSSGTKTLYFRVMYGTEVVGSFDLGLNVKKGTTISVYGSIENLDSTYHVYVRAVNKTKAEATISSENVGTTITEGTDTTTATTDNTTAVVTSKSPQNAASSSTSTTTTGTTVTLPNSILEKNETTGQGTATVTQKTVSHDLTVDVKSEDLAPNAFIIEEADANNGLTAVAGIDLTLVKTTTTKTTVKESAEANANTVTENTVVSTDVVDTFKNGNEAVYVTIETYIAKGLSDVKVRYNGTLASGVAPHVFDENYGTANAITDTSNPAYGTGYYPTTGRLVFKTPHFSSFYVISKNVASIGESYYGSLQAAIDAVKAGETIKLLVDLTLTETLPVERGFDFTLDLNNHNISAKNTRAMRVKEGKLTLAGTGTISSNKEGESSFSAASSVIQVGSGYYTNEEGGDYAGLVVGKDITISSSHCYGITVFGKDTYGQTLDIYGKVLVTGSASAVSGNGTNTLTSTTITIYNGAEVKSTNDYAIYHPQSGTLTVKDGAVVEGNGGIEAKGGQVIIDGGSVKATATEQNHEEYNNGASTSGYALASVMNSNYKGAGSIIVKDGIITGKIVLVSDDMTRPETKLIAAGGTYTVDPRNSGDNKNYVPRGYDVTENSTTPKTWTVTKAAEGVAKIVKGDYNGTDDIFFSTVQGAVDAAETDETVWIIGGHTLNSTNKVEINKKIKLTSTGTVYADETGGIRAIRLVSGAEVSVVGGTWEAINDTTGNNGSIFDVTAGKLIIQDGVFRGANTIIGITEGGEGYFYGGEYHTEDGGCCIYVTDSNSKAYVYGLNYLHEIDDDRGPGAVFAKNGGEAYIYGGTYNFEPLGTEIYSGEHEGCTYTLFDYRNFGPDPFNYARGHIYVYGGLFNEYFNPSLAYDGSDVEALSNPNPYVNYLADGYTVEEVTIENSTWFRVVEAPQQN